MARPFLEIVGSIIGLLAGLTVAFSGYQLARGLTGFAGFLVGAVIGLLVGVPFGPLAMIVAALVVGIVFALLFRFAFRLVGAALGGAGAFALAAALAWPTWAIVLAVVAGIVAGLVLNKLMLVLATAALGAWLATRSAFELLGDLGVGLPWDREVATLVVALVVATLGSLAQWRTVRSEG